LSSVRGKKRGRGGFIIRGESRGGEEVWGDSRSMGK